MGLPTQSWDYQHRHGTTNK